MNWLDPITNVIYAGDDRALIGRGMPPTVPLPHGCGTYPMVPTSDPPDAPADDRNSPLPGYPAPSFVPRVSDASTPAPPPDSP